MKNSVKFRFGAILALMALAACSVNKENKNSEMNADTLIFATNPESVKGKLDVYTTMARATKYNVDAASQGLAKKIYNQNPNLNPKEIINNIKNSDVNDQSRLFAASRVLEFAVIYAVANLEDNAQFIDNYLYGKSAQHLASAAIKVHQDAWFANRKLKEIARLVRTKKKKADELKNKMNRNGTLSSEDLKYKKSLDVALLKLGEFQQSFAMNIAEYEQLTKVLPKEIKLEGRRFYELEDFDENYNIEVFQEAAVRNRNEFAIAKEKIKNYSVGEVRHNVLREYPLTKRLDINGFEIEDDIYEQALYDKALSIADKLLNDVRELRQSKKGSEAWRVNQRMVFDDLSAAILIQVEVSYRLVEQSDADYEANEREIAKVRNAIKKQEKIYRASADEKISLLNDKISLIALEQKSAQIKAERAMALRNLYFNAGLSPFSKALMRGKINDITVSLREAFNHDLVEMLSSVTMQMKSRPVLEQNGWAKGDNWLEEVVKDGYKYRNTRTPLKRGASQNARLAQLGAYRSYDSAMADWKKLSSRFDVLEKYKPKIEEAFVNGKKWYRLRVYGLSDELKIVCNQLIDSYFECLLQ
ncbi:MAG: SPOR domain-containing protein [Alphaproteobacteria bacterium]|nr:SPOR domain-containing protein [Alphaproteobacteria bacterium]